MKVKDFICFCGRLGNLELPERYANDDGREALQDIRVQNLLIGLNYVLEEVCNIAGEVCQINVVSQNGKVDLSGLDVCKVLRLANSCGDIAYRLSVNSLFTDVDGKFQLTYIVRPKKAMWDGELSIPVQLGENAMAAGVLGCYFLSEGDLSQGTVWRERYKTACRESFRKRSSSVLPVGRWFR